MPLDDVVLAIGGFATPAGPQVTAGDADPEGSVTASPGSLFLRSNGTLYTKASGTGNTGWTEGGAGAEGPEGPAGPTGPEGPTGPAGPRGIGGSIVMLPAVGEFVGNILTGTLTTQASAAGRQDIAPFVSAVALTIDQIGMSVSTASAGSACGLIFDADASGRPTTLLAQGADIDTGTTGTRLGAVTFTFEAGKLYYVGTWTSAACTLRCAQTYAHWPMTWTNASTPARQSVLRRTESFGGTSTDWSYAAAQHTSANAPFVLMRVGT